MIKLISYIFENLSSYTLGYWPSMFEVEGLNFDTWQFNYFRNLKLWIFCLKPLFSYNNNNNN